MSDEILQRQNTEDKEEGLSLCYDDRQSTAFSYLDRYFFISYSHCDKAVFEDLRKLYDTGLNFWYDKKLHAGDFWDETVKEKLQDERCAGALIFVSENSVKSQAVEQELKLCGKIKQERNKIEKFFKIIPITLDGGSILKVLRDAFVSCSALGEKELAATLPQERVKTLLDTLSDRILFIGRSVDGSHIAKIVDELKKYEKESGYNFFSGGEATLKKFNGLPGVEISDERCFFELGEYPQEIYEDTPYYLRKGVHKIKDKKLCVLQSGRIYCFSPLKWQVLRIGEDKLTAVTEKVIDFCREDEINTLIDKFRKTAFSEQSIIVDVRLVDIDLLNKFKNIMDKWVITDYASRNNAINVIPLFWSIKASLTMPFSWQSGARIWGKLTKDSNAGIRIVADFKTDQLVKYLGKEKIRWIR